MPRKSKKKNVKTIIRILAAKPKYDNPEFGFENNSYSHRMNLLEKEFDNGLDIISSRFIRAESIC